MKNKEVSQIFNEIADFLEIKGVDYKPRAYRKAARNIEALTEDIESIHDRGELQEIGGIGEALAGKISEYLETGELEYYEEFREELPVDIEGLTNIEGIGPKSVKKLHEGLGIETLEDLERYETVREAAQEVGRTSVFDPRLAYLKARLDRSLYEEGAKAFVERSGSMLYSPGDYTRSKHKAGEIPVSEWDSKAGIKDTTHLERGVTAGDIREGPEEYVLQLDYYRFKNLIDLDPPAGSVYVRAQSEPFNAEMELSEKRLINWLRHFGINEEKDYKPIQIHASGHACGFEIQEMVDAIEPKKLIPVHTENPDAFENEHGKVVKPQMGRTIDF